MGTEAGAPPVKYNLLRSLSASLVSASILEGHRPRCPSRLRSIEINRGRLLALGELLL